MSIKTLELPCGLEAPGAQVIRPAEIQKLKGKVQRDVARIAAQKNADPVDLIEAILRPSVLKIGAEALHGGLLERMLLGDKDWLLFQARIHTWGPLVTVTGSCPKCPKDDNESEFPDFDLSTLEVARVADDARWWSEQGLVAAETVHSWAPDVQAKVTFRAFELNHVEHGIKGVFRFPNGRHQRSIAKLEDKPVEAIWKLMALTCLAWSDPQRQNVKIPQGGLSSDFWEELDLDALTWVQGAYAACMPGVNTQVDMVCKRDHTYKTAVRALDFLSPAAQQQT